MQLTPYVEALKDNLHAAASPGGDEIAEVARLLTQAIEPAVRLSLLEALAGAADEITLALEGATVDARLSGGMGGA